MVAKSLKMSATDMRRAMARAVGAVIEAEQIKAKVKADRIKADEATDTPAAFAQVASGGRWKIAPHLSLLDRVVTDMVTGVSDDESLLISMPPRHGKSEYTSKYLPTWFLGKYPDKRVLNTGYGNKFAESWGRKCRELFTEHGPTYFGRSVSSVKGAANEWLVGGSEGGMLTAGVGGGITGRGCDLLIVDDPVKDAEEALSEAYRERIWNWWQSTCETRLEPGAKKIVVMTRWHNDDLAGRLLAQAQDNGEQWRVINLPAIAEHGDALGRQEGESLWPDRWPIEALIRKRKGRSAYWWNALYQGRPTHSDKAEFPDEYFDNDLIWVKEVPQSCYAKVVALDPSKGKNAKKGDFQASVFVGVWENIAYIDAVIDRYPIGKAVASTLGLAYRYGVQKVAFEANGFQEMIGGEFERQLVGREMHGITIESIENYGSKESRIQSLDPFLKNRELRFVDSPGCRLLVSQLREFPMATHDDGPDALEMAIRKSLGMLQPAVVANPVQEILTSVGFQ